MLRLLSVCIAALTLVLASPSTCEQSKGKSIPLVKKAEFYLRQGVGIPSGVYASTVPRFAVTGSGYFAVESHDWIYLYDEDSNLIRKIGGKGLEPGRFPYVCYSVTVSDKCEIVATDVRRRVNVYDGAGNLLKTLFVPEFRFSPTLSRKYDTYLIASGTCMDIAEGIFVYDYNTGRAVTRFFRTEEDELELLSSKNAGGWFPGPLFTVTPDGHVLCTKMFDHRIFEYSLSGELLYVYDKVPPHYISLREVQAAPPSEHHTGEEEDGQWEATWSYTGCPSMYHGDMFVVPRRLLPPYYLDFYSITEKRYLGYCELGEKPFVYSDSNHIYLYEHLSDTLVVVGKYTTSIAQKEVKVESEEAPAESLPASYIRNVMTEALVDTAWGGVEETSRFSIVDLSGRRHAFGEFLTSAPRSIVIFVRPFYDCPFTAMYEGVREFCAQRDDYQLYVVISHPFKEELEFLLGGLTLEAIVVPNLKPGLVMEIAPSYPYPGLVVFDRDGSVLATYSTYDLYGEGGKPIDEFLREVDDMDSSE